MSQPIDRQAEFSGTRDVREAHRFDEAALTDYLQTPYRRFQPPMTVEQFKGGQSNPTYKLVTPLRLLFCAASHRANCCRRPMRLTGNIVSSRRCTHRACRLPDPICCVRTRASSAPIFT